MGKSAQVRRFCAATCSGPSQLLWRLRSSCIPTIYNSTWGIPFDYLSGLPGHRLGSAAAFPVAEAEGEPQGGEKAMARRTGSNRVTQRRRGCRLTSQGTLTIPAPAVHQEDPSRAFRDPPTMAS